MKHLSYHTSRDALDKALSALFFFTTITSIVARPPLIHLAFPLAFTSFSFCLYQLSLLPLPAFPP